MWRKEARRVLSKVGIGWMQSKRKDMVHSLSVLKDMFLSNLER